MIYSLKNKGFVIVISFFFFEMSGLLLVLEAKTVLNVHSISSLLYGEICFQTSNV